jgi:hypothetical protein
VPARLRGIDTAHPLLEHSELQQVIVFRDLLRMMHRYNWAGPRNNSSTAFAWFRWRRGYTGLLMIQRISAADFHTPLPLPVREAAE